ncbi:hypothetical protein PCE1_000033 [Barthelona sp. PCE]
MGKDHHSSKKSAEKISGHLPRIESTQKLQPDVLAEILERFSTYITVSQKISASDIRYASKTLPNDDMEILSMIDEITDKFS